MLWSCLTTICLAAPEDITGGKRQLSQIWIPKLVVSTVVGNLETDGETGDLLTSVAIPTHLHSPADKSQVPLPGLLRMAGAGWW